MTTRGRSSCRSQYAIRWSAPRNQFDTSHIFHWRGQLNLWVEDLAPTDLPGSISTLLVRASDTATRARLIRLLGSASGIYDVIHRTGSAQLAALVPPLLHTFESDVQTIPMDSRPASVIFNPGEEARPNMWDCSYLPRSSSPLRQAPYFTAQMRTLDLMTKRSPEPAASGGGRFAVTCSESSARLVAATSARSLTGPRVFLGH